MSTRHRYTRESLEAALIGASSLHEVVLNLGLDDSPYRRRYVGERLRALGLDRSRLRGLHIKYPPDLLAEAAARSTSNRGVVRYLNARAVGGTESHIRRQLMKHGIDTSHFTGRTHNRGVTSPRRLSADDILVKRAAISGRTQTRLLRRALDDLGVEARCGECGITPSWRGKPLTLEIDHINGDLTDNRRENLRYVCPNCHAITQSYCRKLSVR
jgi:HNH endonuclease